MAFVLDSQLAHLTCFMLHQDKLTVTLNNITVKKLKNFKNENHFH